MNVVYLSPGFPAEMPLFVRGLAQVGAKVYGVGDQPVQALPPEAREGLTDYLQVRSFGDEAAGSKRSAAGSGVARSTASSACGSGSCTSPPPCGRPSGCPA